MILTMFLPMSWMSPSMTPRMTVTGSRPGARRMCGLRMSTGVVEPPDLAHPDGEAVVDGDERIQPARERLVRGGGGPGFVHLHHSAGEFFEKGGVSQGGFSSWH